MTFYADRTDYPRIYRDVYWGNFSGDYVTEEIIAHRNEFVPAFGIKEKCRKTPVYLLEFLRRRDRLFDHTEVYETKDKKYVIVNSPYCTSPENEARLIEMGFVKYNQMYSKDATTFVIVRDKRKKKGSLP